MLERNIQILATELFKIVNGDASDILKEVFPLKDSKRYPLRSIFKTRNVRTVNYGTETLPFIGQKSGKLSQKLSSSLRLFMNLKNKSNCGNQPNALADCVKITLQVWDLWKEYLLERALGLFVLCFSLVPPPPPYPLVTSGIKISEIYKMDAINEISVLNVSPLQILFLYDMLLSR